MSHACALSPSFMTITSNANRRRASMIAPPPSATATAGNQHKFAFPRQAPASATRPRSALSPSLNSAKNEGGKTPVLDVWKSRAGPGTIRTSPPQTSLPYDADIDQDPLFGLVSDHGISHAPQCFRLKLIDMDPSSSPEDENELKTFFSFTASPVQSPSFSATTFHARHSHRPTPLSLPLPSPTLLHPDTPNVVAVRDHRSGDKVDRWIHSGGLEPMPTPMLVEDSPHELWDNGGQSDWREVIDRFLQHIDGDCDDPHYPLTPVRDSREERENAPDRPIRRE
ncbi:hypothetical protein BD413DRAFT_643332 [Trametes elegans]|nr:hypothetical protein BD413DRAFT_643332 [Trametes elegans]